MEHYPISFFFKLQLIGELMEDLVSSLCLMTFYNHKKFKSRSFNGQFLTNYWFWPFHITPVWYSVKIHQRDSSWSFWGVLLVCRTKFGINFHVCIWRLNSIDTRTNIFCIGFRCKYRGCQVLAGVVTGVHDPVLNFGLTLLEVKSVSDFNFRPEIRVRQVWCFLR
jgi:hypothetical protein